MLSEISSLKEIIGEAIKQYGTLNKKCVTDIINMVVEL
jgi:hypothetical protein